MNLFVYIAAVNIESGPRSDKDPDSSVVPPDNSSSSSFQVAADIILAGIGAGELFSLSAFYVELFLHFTFTSVIAHYYRLHIRALCWPCFWI
jgi:hypothetical protein